MQAEYAEFNLHAKPSKRQLLVCSIQSPEVQLKLKISELHDDVTSTSCTARGQLASTSQADTTSTWRHYHSILQLYSTERHHRRSHATTRDAAGLNKLQPLMFTSSMPLSSKQPFNAVSRTQINH
jgi:hypothetical protein